MAGTMQTRFGSREICNVVFKAKSDKTIGSKTFVKGEPVFIFDSLKTSSLESAATTVYATGGRGNTRLVAWEGEKTVTFTMEDALISPLTFSILSGANLTQSNGVTNATMAKVHFSATAKASSNTNIAFGDDLPYTMNGTDKVGGFVTPGAADTIDYYQVYLYEIDETGSLGSPVSFSSVAFAANDANYSNFKDKVTITGGNLTANSYYLIDAYAYAPAMTLTVGPEDFAGSYYIEADTLFREESTGDDKPAQFVIPHGKVQSQYTFSMAATGDPSTFTFTVDAFPDYVNFDRSRKVLFALNILG